MCLCPILANADSCSNHDNDRSGCLSLGGCEWTPDNNNGDGFCNDCSVGYANAPCSGSNCPESCQDCASEWQHYGTGQTFDNNDPSINNTTGTSSCPWICEANYYQSGNSCLACPQYSTTQNHPNGGATSITDCKCASHYYMGGSGNNECISCPEHSSCHTNGPDNNTGLTFNNVTCDSGYTRYINNNEVTCSIGCGLYAVSNSSNDGCICNVGYYGDGTTCSACPIGTTSAQGSQNISDCVMTSTTLFCDGTGQNCMQLIPNGITISAH